MFVKEKPARKEWFSKERKSLEGMQKHLLQKFCAHFKRIECPLNLPTWLRPRLGPARSLVLLSAFDSVLVGLELNLGTLSNWYCRLITRVTVSGRAAGTIPNSQQNEPNDSRSCKHSVVTLQDRYSYKKNAIKTLSKK